VLHSFIFQELEVCSGGEALVATGLVSNRRLFQKLYYQMPSGT